MTTKERLQDLEESRLMALLQQVVAEERIPGMLDLAERERRLRMRMKAGPIQPPEPARGSAWRPAYGFLATIVAVGGLALAMPIVWPDDPNGQETLDRAVAHETRAIDQGDAWPRTLAVTVLPVGRGPVMGCDPWEAVVPPEGWRTRYLPGDEAKRLMTQFLAASEQPLSAVTYQAWLRRERPEEQPVTHGQHETLILHAVNRAGPLSVDLSLRHDRAVALQLRGATCRIDIDVVAPVTGGMAER